MKRIVESFEATVFAHATEDEGKVLKSLLNILPEETDVKRSLLSGHYGNPIVKFCAKCRGRKAQNAFDLLLAKMSKEDLETLQEHLEKMIDPSCHLYLRLNKQEAYERRIVVSRGDDVIHVRVKILSRPAKASGAVRVVKEHIAEVLKCGEKEGAISS